MTRPSHNDLKPFHSADSNETQSALESLHIDSRSSDVSSQPTDDDALSVFHSYDDIPIIEITKLPRGGISMDTQSVGTVQFGIPPETIKDSMRLGLKVPTVYIVPVERFCREIGPALGVNLAEFEFPAYFNFFVQQKRCTLIVDSEDAEQNIRKVFSETLLGPAQFRREDDPVSHEPEDFAPDFNSDRIPNFQKEFKHFRIMPDGKELVLETLLDFCHFRGPDESGVHGNLGVPPPIDDVLEEDMHRTSIVSDDGEESVGSVGRVVHDISDVERVEKRHRWSYSHARFNGDVATVWPPGTTPEQMRLRNVKRAEIFKLPGGTEYILHDIDENNIIIGKVRFAGHVKVSESISVMGFGSEEEALDTEADMDDENSSSGGSSILRNGPPTFHPPSFGVTVLGNSHGFDKSGSVSGYVLWINGRGVMIDPPPYSSATLEREGIRPRMIVGIILTHCHADHDAGAFQKVLTGQPVVVITTPTIYKSFIRKYAALSALSPALLRHSHRYKAAIIGQPLRFQGATFEFIYSLHTIPCVGFRVEWRGRSLVFTGDHFNSPPDIDKLQETGVLSKARADDLRNLPLQETDLLLHEAGAPPIHTPLDVLVKLPEKVKKRMYVVHTSAMPEGCDLRVAPTGTAGTIRLDQHISKLQDGRQGRHGFDSSFYMPSLKSQSPQYLALADDAVCDSPWSGSKNEYESCDSLTESAVSTSTQNSFGRLAGRLSVMNHHTPPLVSLRPASSTDAWFVLNLLSAVPFLTSLSYSSTMEVLETARVDAFCMGDVILPASMRSQLLCVVWEGTCVERPKQQSDHSARITSSGSLDPVMERKLSGGEASSVWHAGDWTGPVSLQPEKRLSCESLLSETHDIVAMSSEGVKVITIEFSSLHAILKSGSSLYRKYLERRTSQEKAMEEIQDSSPLSSSGLIGLEMKEELNKSLSVLDLLELNSAFRKLSAVQKRHLESLAEGPVSFCPGERLWRAGTAVDKAYIVVAGTVSFIPGRRNAGSVSWSSNSNLRGDREGKGGNRSLGESMRIDAIKAVKELSGSEFSGPNVPKEVNDRSQIQLDSVFGLSNTGDSNSDEHVVKASLTDANDFSDENGLDLENDDAMVTSDNSHVNANESSRPSLSRRRSSRARFANKVLGRMYSRRALTEGLVFSRGHFLGDVSKMVAGKLLRTEKGGDEIYNVGTTEEPLSRNSNLLNTAIEEEESSDTESIVHSSTLTAGKDGCIVLFFPRSNLIPFLDEYPGVLLSLLGTQVIV